jgi:hypothetical protein
MALLQPALAEATAVFPRDDAIVPDRYYGMIVTLMHP